MRLHAIASGLLVAFSTAGAQSTSETRYVMTGLFIGAIEEGARIFTPTRLLPLDHPEANGHDFPTVLQFHRGEDRLLVVLGVHAGLRLSATLQRYPVQPDTLWPYAAFLPPPADSFETVTPVIRDPTSAPVPGLRAVAYLDRVPLAFIVDTRGLTLAERRMRHATTMGLDMTRSEFVAGLERAAREVPSGGAAVLVYQR